MLLSVQTELLPPEGGQAQTQVPVFPTTPGWSGRKPLPEQRVGAPGTCRHRDEQRVLRPCGEGASGLASPLLGQAGTAATGTHLSCRNPIKAGG